MNDEELQSTDDVDELMHQKSFGARFTAAREAENLSLADVSDELKLPEETIHALELSSIEQLPAPAFTQGYIRSYAKFLKLPEDEILEIYNQLLPEKETPLSARSSLPRQAHSGETRIKLTTYAFVLTGLLVMIAWWYQSVSNSTDTNVADDKVFVVTDDKSDAGMEESNDSVEVVVDVGPVNNTVSENIEPEEKPVLESPVEARSVETRPVEAKPVEVREDDFVAKSLKTTTGDVTEIIAASGEDVLVLGTISESWVEVQDVATPRLVFELIKKGSYYRVQGQAPFKIFLGNAPSVSIQMNGKAVDVLSHLRSDKLVHVYIYKNGEVVSVSRHENSNNNIKIQSSVSEDDQQSDAVLPELE